MLRSVPDLAKGAWAQGVARCHFCNRLCRRSLFLKDTGQVTHAEAGAPWLRSAFRDPQLLYSNTTLHSKMLRTAVERQQFEEIVAAQRAGAARAVPPPRSGKRAPKETARRRRELAALREQKKDERYDCTICR